MLLTVLYKLLPPSFSIGGEQVLSNRDRVQKFKLDEAVSSIQGASVDISQTFLPHIFCYSHTQFFFPAFLYIFHVDLV